MLIDTYEKDNEDIEDEKNENKLSNKFQFKIVMLNEQLEVKVILIRNISFHHN